MEDKKQLQVNRVEQLVAEGHPYFKRGILESIPMLVAKIDELEKEVEGLKGELECLREKK